MPKDIQKPTPKPAPIAQPTPPTPPTSASGVLGVTVEEAENLQTPAIPPLDTKPAELRTPLPDSFSLLPDNSFTERLPEPDMVALAKGIKALFEMTGHQIPGDIRASIEDMAARKFCPAVR